MTAAQGEDTGSADTMWVPDQGLTDLYAVSWHSLVRLSWLLVRDQQLAEERAPDAFVAMSSHWSRQQDRDLALAYLRRAVVNSSHSLLRHRRVEGRYLSSQTSAMTAHGSTK